MKFELNEYHKNITKEELIDDLISVSKKLNKDYISRSEYEKNGKFSATPYIKNFGTWISACKEAGLKTEREKDDFVRVSTDTLIDDIIRVSKLLEKNTISTKDYKENGRYRVQTILLRFTTWAKALEAANLQMTNFKVISNEDLYADIEKMWINKGTQPTTTDVKNGLSQYSLNTFARRFGGWRKALESFIEYINMESSNYENVIQTSFDRTKTLQNNETREKRRRTPRDINLRLRFLVMQRDNFKCCMCGASPAKNPNVELHIDHVVPWSKGGETTMENLQTLCSKCNLGKSNL